MKDEKFSQSVESKLEQIRHALINSNRPKQLGLLGGESGVALFFIYYYQFTENEEDLEVATGIIENVISNVRTLFSTGTTFASGITGFALLLQHINNHSLVEIEMGDFLDNLDEALYRVMIYEVRRGNYDYLHGAIGIGLYYLSRPQSKNNRAYLGRLVEELDRMGRKEDGSYFWEAFDPETEQSIEKQVNLGLAHGLPSILQFLMRAFAANILPELTLEMIVATKNSLFGYRNDFEKYGSYYPAVADEGKENGSHSRMAWCYGDLGLCLSLFQAAKLTKDAEMENELIAMFRKEATRRDFVKDQIWDAAFCHGATGVAYMFGKVFQMSGEEVFAETAGFWYEIALSMARFEDGLAGYKTYRPHPQPAYEKNFSMLEGISGIGLCLLSTISNKPNHWEEFFLMDIVNPVHE